MRGIDVNLHPLDAILNQPSPSLKLCQSNTAREDQHHAACWCGRCVFNSHLHHKLPRWWAGFISPLSVKQALHFITLQGIWENETPVMFQQLRSKASRNFLLEILWNRGRGAILPPKVVKTLHMLISKVVVKEKEKFQQKFQAMKECPLSHPHPRPIYLTKKSPRAIWRHTYQHFFFFFFFNSCPFLEEQYILVNSLRQVRVTLEACSL